jgi:hypothetical protein
VRERASSAVARGRRALRAPRVVVGELLAIAVAGVALTVVPQVTDPRAARAFGLEHPLASRVASALALDRILQSGWFAALLVAVTASLAVVLLDQWRRAVRLWRAPLAETDFRSAPYRREFERAAAPIGARPPGIRRTGALGLMGSPMLHAGLLVVVLAGAGRALFWADASVDLVEGEALPPDDPAAWSAQWAGPAARPFTLAEPLVLVRLEPARHPTGSLARIAARVAVGAPPGGREARIEVNDPLRLGADHLYVSATHGPAALVEIHSRDGHEAKTLLLEEGAGGKYRVSTVEAGGLEVKLRGAIGPDAALPGSLDLRVLRRGALLATGSLRPGQLVEFGSGEWLRLADIRYWASFQGARDGSRGWAFAGFALAVLGFALSVAVVRVDTAVLVTPSAGGERVVVALRPQRFAPLYAERFERLVREQGGPVREEG